MNRKRTTSHPVAPHGLAGENVPPERETRTPAPRCKEARP